MENIYSIPYLFDRPHFITLDGSQPEGIPLQGLRVAMNGIEAPVGQTYATMDQTLSASPFGELGQPLSDWAAVLPLEKVVGGKITFIADVADDFLEHVLERRDAFDRAVLVHDDREMAAGVLVGM